MRSSGGQPLRGRRILVTRPRDQSAHLTEMLRGLGAEILEIPAIRIDPPTDPEALRQAASAAAKFDWIVFTSVNGVERFVAAFDTGGGARDIGNALICAIGPATAEAATQRFGRVDLIADVHTAEGVLEALNSRGEVAGRRFLLPQAAGAREVLVAGLRDGGAEVVAVEAYRTVTDDNSADQLRRELERGGVDMVTFASASSVRSVVELTGGPLRGPMVATIGPVTSAAVRTSGMNVDVEADPHTVPGLVEAIRSFFDRQVKGA